VRQNCERAQLGGLYKGFYTLCWDPKRERGVCEVGWGEPSSMRSCASKSEAGREEVEAAMVSLIPCQCQGVLFL
jgi:hypothetical protein